MDATDFENLAVHVKEKRITLFRQECMLASVAAEANAAAWLAHLWAVSTHSINRLARIWETFPIQDIRPDVPLALYGAALDIDYPVFWLQRALAEGWSPRQLRDQAGIAKGKHLSDMAFRGHDVEVIEWNIETGTFAAAGLPLSGEMPERASVTVREVLSREK